MRGCAIAFNIVGLVGTIISCSGLIASGFSTNTIPMAVIGIISIFLCIIVGTMTLVSLNKKEKRVSIGVLSIIFNGVVGGILYLCWNPYRINTNNRSNKELSNLDELKKLKELLDMGAITKEEYNKKKKEYIDL